jgi:hypothetical protein
MVLLEPTILSQPGAGVGNPMNNALTDKLIDIANIFRSGAVFHAVGRLAFVSKIVPRLLLEGGGVLLGMHALP